MEKDFNIQTYMTRGVAKVMAAAVVATLANRKESAFMRSFAKAAYRASDKRSQAEKTGEHIPNVIKIRAKKKKKHISKHGNVERICVFLKKKA